MNFQNRTRGILAALEEHGSIDVHTLATLLQASEMTIRRDLVQLADQGLLIRTRGGAMRVDMAQPFRFEHKAAQRYEQKVHIAQLAAQQIEEGDTVFLDCGSTVFQLCPFIRHKRIQIITNSLPIVSELLGSSVTINLVGGEVDADRQAVHGLMAAQHMQQYRAKRAFIGVDGLSSQHGLSANSEKEASTALQMAAQAEHTYLLCDSSKLERTSYFQFAPLTLAQVLITDAGADPALVTAYQQAGLTVLL
ncbi:transcriptional regulator, DeoR family [Fibrella aestuarina BUZ 2]|uniref:Transcriptional regulator, DeoR family n=1 Tax=Fibrella aestuarina BUZ 2 TaxID=1166018 RepID=I0KA72_9BACT|nr:DeoR/GlpR family DNA-binding transcription regulator [Fibrella aestuarina]CCH01025.1 transcriptional regulator, DeoR family [Fibrella aestuarina BUZ 2]